MCYNYYGDNMRDLFKILFMFILLVIVFIYKNNIASFITDHIIYRGSNTILTYNEYYLENDYKYVQNTDIKTATNYQEILNIIYTIINSGDDCFSFYCNYDNCDQDIKKITKDNTIVTNINNFVHPYNSFNTINIDVSTNNKITVKVKRIYNEEQIEYIDKYLNNFINTKTNLAMTDYDKIKIFHDYIVNNTKYDEENTFTDYTAYNLLTSGRSICSGYSDVMAIYLNTLGIKNYKITSKGHIWNLVKLNDKWYHLDMTWDDPIATDGNQYLLHNYFMITTDKLFELDKLEHNFDTNIFKEAK